MESSENNESYSINSEFNSTPPKTRHFHFSKKSLEEYKRIAFSDENLHTQLAQKHTPSGILKQITDFLSNNSQGATLLEISEYLENNWPGLKSTRGFSYGKGETKRIVLGALNSSKNFEIIENPDTKVKIWKIRDDSNEFNSENLLESAHKSKTKKSLIKSKLNMKENSVIRKPKSKKIPLSLLNTKIRVPKTAKNRARCKEILTLLESIYEKSHNDISYIFSPIDVFFGIVNKKEFKRR